MLKNNGITYTLKALERSASRIVNRFLMKFKKMFRYRSQINKAVNQSVKSMQAYIAEKPRSKQDYVKVRTRYVAKKFLIVLALGILLFIFVGKNYILPKLEGKLWTPTIVVNSEKFRTYTGKAKVVDGDRQILYEGEVDEGRINGKGILYDDEGRTIYSGMFSMEQYEGMGEQYSKEGKLIYKGEFASNLYQGYGELYDDDGRKKYVGEFVNGQYSGQGTLYYPNGPKKFVGNFQAGNKDGVGQNFAEDGTLVYEGPFKNDEYSGQGKLYHNGHLIYEGNFVDGKYEGTGIQYDENTGQIVYQGNFAQGVYDGQGKQYAIQTGRILYEGEFRSGVYFGEGTLYDEKGEKLYTGPFYNGQVDYIHFVSDKIEDVRDAFGKEDELLTLQNQFQLLYQNLDVAFIFDYRKEGEDIRVHKIVLFGDQSIFDTKNGMTKKEIEEKLGIPFVELYLNIDEEKDALLTFSQLGDLNRLYGVKFLQDEFFIRYYFQQPDGEVLYFEIGET